MDSDDERLRDMLDSATKAVQLVQDKQRVDLDSDEVLALALVRLLEILGEAAKGVSEDARGAHPEIPWRSITATRDRLIHGYFSVDLDIVWQIIRNDLPPVVDALQTILNNEQP